MAGTEHTPDEYRVIFENVSDAIAVYALDSPGIVEANPAACELFGYTREEIIGLGSETLVHPSSHHLIPQFAQAVAAGRSIRARAPAVRKDGSVIHLEIRGVPFMFRGSVHMLSVARDVTEQVASEEELRRRVAEQTRDLQALLDLSRSVTSILDLERLYEVALDRLGELVPYAGAAIQLVTPGGPRQVATRRPAGAASTPVEAPAWYRTSIWASLAAGMPVVIGDIHGDEALANEYRSTLPDGLSESPLSFFRSWMLVPLIVKDHSIGAIGIIHQEPGFFRQEHVSLVQSVANHVAIAIENARLFDETARKAREVEALLQANESMHRSLALSDVFEAVVDVATNGLGLDFASLMLRDGTDGGLIVRAQKGFPQRRRDAVEIRSLPAQPAETGVVWAVADTADAEDEVNQSLTTSLGMRSLVQVPIAYHGANGVFLVGYRRPHEWSPDEIRLFQALAERAALAIENARLFEESQERRREIEALYQADEKLFNSLDLDEVLQSLADIAVDILGADKSVVSLAQRGSGLNFPRAWRNLSPEIIAFLGGQRPAEPDDMRSGVAVPREDLSVRHPETRAALEREGIVSTLDVPIMFEGRLGGAFGLGWLRSHKFTEEEKRLGLALAQRAAVAINNAELFARAQQAASLEERQRLARELHDSVSQALYGIALGSKTARAQLDRDPTRASCNWQKPAWRKCAL
jgi:PAS domain S-box-containing protein